MIDDAGIYISDCNFKKIFQATIILIYVDKYPTTLKNLS